MLEKKHSNWFEATEDLGTCKWPSCSEMLHDTGAQEVQLSRQAD